MKRFKKMLRVTGVMVLIILALFGIGIIGGVPVPTFRRKENTVEIRTELKETRETEGDIILFENRT
jgi:hypothetical protein